MSSDWFDTVYGPMPMGLSSSKLSRLCVDGGVQTGPFGSQLHQEDYVDQGTPIVTVEHLGENRIVHSNLPRVSEEDGKRLSKYVLQKGDIVFSRVGSVDRRALVQSHEDGWLFSGRCLRVRPNPALLDSRWLSYFFGLQAFKNYIRGIAVGATMPSINTKILSEIPIYFPDIEVQRQAATVLSQLDDRITLLRETNATLDAIAQTLFKSWFVNFDPVRAKSEGRAPEGMDEATAALFPDSLEESELGRVPKTWRPVRLDSFIELAYGKALKAEHRNLGGVPVYGSGGVTGWHDAALVDTPSIIVGRKGTVGSLYWESRPFFPIDTVFYVRSSRPLTYCYELLKTLGLSGMNTDAAVPGLNRENVYRLMVPGVPNAVLAKFDEIVAALRDKADHNCAQARTLSALRDHLLPRLITGRICCSDPQAIVERSIA